MLKTSKIKRCNKSKCISKDFPLDKRSNYIVVKSYWPYNVSKYAIYDNYNSYQGGANTKRECNAIIKKHISNGNIVMKQLRKEYCEKQKNKKRKTYKGVKCYDKNKIR